MLIDGELDDCATSRPDRSAIDSWQTPFDFKIDQIQAVIGGVKTAIAVVVAAQYPTPALMADADTESILKLPVAPQVLMINYCFLQITDTNAQLGEPLPWCRGLPIPTDVG